MDLGAYHALNGVAGHAGWLDWLVRRLATDLPVLMAGLVAAAWFWPGAPAARGRRQYLAAYAVAAAFLGFGAGLVVWRSRRWIDPPLAAGLAVARRGRLA